MGFGTYHEEMYLSLFQLPMSLLITYHHLSPLITRCQLIYDFYQMSNITLRFFSVSCRSELVLRYTIASGPTRSNTVWEVRSPQPTAEEIDTDASGFISPDEILEHTSNPAVWLGWSFWCEKFLGEVLWTFFEAKNKKRCWEKHQQQIRKNQPPCHCLNIILRSFRTKKAWDSKNTQKI